MTETPFTQEVFLEKLKKLRDFAPNKEVRDNLIKKIEELEKKIAENDG